jgi:undecaprenyl-diphosphatase
MRLYQHLLLLRPCRVALNIWLQVIILGVVEGITEFLPISSTGHLIITARLLDFSNDIGGTFEIFIQLGAVLAVVFFYAKDLLDQARGIICPGSKQSGWNEPRRLWLHILIAFLPAAVVGLALHHWIKEVLFRPSVIAITLILGGLIFLMVERWRKRPSTTQNIMHISWRQALGIGAAQTLALIPGVSRSGASIIGGMLAGLDRPTATAFSFYLAIPTLGGATVVDLLSSLSQVTPADIYRLLIGTIVSFFVAWLSIGWLLRYVSQKTFIPFGFYRILAGLAVGALIFTQWQ